MSASTGHTAPMGSSGQWPVWAVCGRLILPIHRDFKLAKVDRSTSRQAAKTISDKFGPHFSFGFENLQRSLDIDTPVEQGASNQDP